MIIEAQAVRDALDGLPIPFAGAAWGALAERDDLTTPPPLLALSSHSGRLQWLVRIRGAWDPVEQSDVDVLLSTDGYHTAADGEGAPWGLGDFAGFRAALVQPGSVRVSVGEGGRLGLGGAAAFGRTVATIADGALGWLRRLRYALRPMERWVGDAEGGDGRFSRFHLDRRGVVSSVSWDEDTITWSMADAAALLDEAEVNGRAYLGFGTAVRLRAPGDAVRIFPQSEFHPGQATFRVVVRQLAAGNAVLLSYGWSPSSPVGWELRIHADGSVLWLQGNYERVVLTPAGVAPAGETHRVTWEGGSGGVAIYVDGEERVRDTAPYTAPSVNPATAELWLGRRP